MKLNYCNMIVIILITSSAVAKSFPINLKNDKICDQKLSLGAKIHIFILQLIGRQKLFNNMKRTRFLDESSEEVFDSDENNILFILDDSNESQ